MMLNPTDPIRPVREVDLLLKGMTKGGFQGRKLGETAEIWKMMIKDPDALILLGLSGAMIPAGMQECLIELVQHRFVDVIVSTGANIFHDICEHCGVRHYIGHHHVDDHHLYEQGIDRIYDVFAYEEQFRVVDGIIADFASTIPGFEGSSRSFLRQLGLWLKAKYPKGRSLLSTCVSADLPLFIPALSDSSIGIGLVMARRRGIRILVDQILDADEITGIVEEKKKTGVVYIGGGVPKNFIQQTQVIASVNNNERGGHDYAVQFTTDTPHFGGLSGCTFEEAISWGKESDACKMVQCFCDATISVPLVTSALLNSGVIRANR